MADETSYTAIIAGTGFASSFFLKGLLEKLPADARVLVLERGHRRDHAWQVEHRRHSTINHRDTFRAAGDPDKEWLFTIGFGGSSNCWWACTPRFMPNDFHMASLYGVGTDWPIGYDELAPYYERTEEIMSISGADDGTPFPRRGPYPQPPHAFTDPDRLMKAAWPDQFFIQPTARARQGTVGRGSCCANAVCELCPVDAKFTISNGLADIYADPRVTLETGAEVLHIELANGLARGLVYRQGEAERSVAGELVALGTNAMFNASILLRSGYAHPLLGRYLNEQASRWVFVKLDGLDNFQGSTSITGHGYMLYDGPHRKRHAGCLLEFWNRPEFRLDPGRFRQIMRLKIIAEDLPQAENRIELDPADENRPRAIHAGPSAYALDGLAAAQAQMPEILAPLPVEEIAFSESVEPTESHILGTVRMGWNATDSVVDDRLLCHDVRNLAVLGGSAFPTSPPANPTLTLSAMSLRAADLL